MTLSRRTALEAGLGALTAVAVGGCLDESGAESDDGESTGNGNASDDDRSLTDSSSENDSEDDSVPEMDDPDEYPGDIDESDGSETGTTDERGYETYAANGHEIPMAPTSDVYEWYTDDEELVIIDARSAEAYEEVHVRGAVSSPVRGEPATEEPLAGVEPDTRIVTYCTCPRTLSGHRAAELREAGYTDVYLLADGLQDWAEKGHPIDGTAVN